MIGEFCPKVFALRSHSRFRQGAVGYYMHADESASIGIPPWMSV